MELFRIFGWSSELVGSRVIGSVTGNERTVKGEGVISVFFPISFRVRQGDESIPKLKMKWLSYKRRIGLDERHLGASVSRWCPLTKS